MDYNDLYRERVLLVLFLFFKLLYNIYNEESNDIMEEKVVRDLTFSKAVCMANTLHDDGINTVLYRGAWKASNYNSAYTTAYLSIYGNGEIFVRASNVDISTIYFYLDREDLAASDWVVEDLTHFLTNDI